jgi:hypothetical protein
VYSPKAIAKISNTSIIIVTPTLIPEARGLVQMGTKVTLKRKTLEMNKMHIFFAQDGKLKVAMIHLGNADRNSESERCQNGTPTQPTTIKVTAIVTAPCVLESRSRVQTRASGVANTAPFNRTNRTMKPKIVQTFLAVLKIHRRSILAAGRGRLPIHCIERRMGIDRVGVGRP